MLSFVMTLAKDFCLGMSIKSLFCALVRPTLEYGVVVWNPYTVSYSRQLERIQRKFLWFARHLLRIPCEPHDYTSVTSQCSCLDTLAER